MRVNSANKTAVQALRRTALIAIVLLIWDTATRAGSIPGYILPSPGAVWMTFVQDLPILWPHAQETLFEWAVGLALSTLLAIALSLLAFEIRGFERTLIRALVISQSVPYLTIAPLLLLWFGLGAAPKLILILLTCTFPITQLTLTGLTHARSEYATLAVMLRMGKSAALRKIYAPAALPEFFEGIKISVTYAFVSSVLAELIGSEAGLGVYLSRAQSAYRTDRVMVAVLLIVAFSLLCHWLVGLMARKSLFWKVRDYV